MTRRPIAAVLAGTVVLLAVLNLVVYSLYRSGRQAVERALAERLDALGRTAARLLASSADRAALLAALVDENHLEDAYLFDASYRILAGARTPAGSRLNLLRVDVARAQAALERRGSVAGAALADVPVEIGYFPVAPDAVLALEAGSDFRAPAAGLASRWWTAVALSAVLGAGFFAALVRWLRALERARVAQMAAMVAHEVRNPLGILRAQAELLAERAGMVVAPRERERLAEMLVEIDRLNVLTDEFLALARDAPLETAPCDVAALVRETLDRIRRDPAAAGARIEVEAGEGLAVLGDRGKLGQALFNLVRNAVQIGGAGVAVQVAAARDGAAARITVADDGPGIPPELRATLFEPFVGARPGGSGLGLAVARRVAERHGGRLVLDPTARGASFSLYLPLQERAWPAS
jgi:signal transduction histidine kinase